MRTTRFALSTVAVTALAALVIAASAAAAGGTHTQSMTQNFHGTQTTTDLNPCNGDTVDLNLDSNIVFHITYFPSSDEEWSTFTEEDKFTASDEGTGVLYTGHSTFWGNFNMNRQNSNSTFTSTVRGTGSDGSTILYHEVGHYTMLPNGQIAVSFDKPSLTCG
jgi:hypothetical protein